MDEAKGTLQPVAASLESLNLSVACVGAPERAFTWLAWLIIAMNLRDGVQMSHLGLHCESSTGLMLCPHCYCYLFKLDYKAGLGKPVCAAFK